jgi:hypothetical protein
MVATFRGLIEMVVHEPERVAELSAVRCCAGLSGLRTGGPERAALRTERW